MTDLRKKAAALLLGHLITDARRADIRRQLRAIEAHRPKALRTLPYGHEMGPTGTAPKTFGHVGGGNRSGTASPGTQAWRNAKRNGSLPAAFWDPTLKDQNRQFDALRKQRSRIDKNGGERKPAHRPRTITAEQEQRVRNLLIEGIGVNKTAKLVGIGNSGVQRIRNEMAEGIPQVVRVTNEGEASMNGAPIKEEELT